MNKFYGWLGLCACLALPVMAWADDDHERGEDDERPSYSLGSGSLGNGKVKVSPGMPNYDTTGRPYQWTPRDGGGSALGPVNPNAYGPGVGSDATGRPVRAVPLP